MSDSSSLRDRLARPMETAAGAQGSGAGSREPAARPAQTPRPLQFAPRKVSSLEDIGLPAGFLSDLVLKALYARSQATPAEIMEIVKLPYYGVVEELLRDLSAQEFCYIARGQSMNPLSYTYTITVAGQERAQEISRRNAYVGAAPVTLEAYWRAVSAQTLDAVTVTEADLRRAFRHLVIDDALIDQLGPAVNSARSIFVFGPPGNGKTAIAETLVRMQGGDIYVPHAILVGGDIIRVFDPVHHPLARPDQPESTDDPRWVLCKRPVVTVGGELTLAMLDLIYSATSRFYEAPYQVKANNGAFFIDDFGRQQVAPRDLLNRWIVPLEKREDYLTLQTGQKIEVPFDTLVMFSTNLDPKELVDEAFLRRIRYKIEIKSPTPDQYRTIFRRVCEAKGIEYVDSMVDYLLQEKYPALRVEPRAVHPRDLIEQVVDFCDYKQTPRALSRETLDFACTNYFVRW